MSKLPKYVALVLYMHALQSPRWESTLHHIETRRGMKLDPCHLSPPRTYFSTSVLSPAPLLSASKNPFSSGKCRQRCISPLNLCGFVISQRHFRLQAFFRGFVLMERDLEESVEEKPC